MAYIKLFGDPDTAVNLDRLLRNAAGALTINSTTGIHALRAKCPTKVLGIALYDIAGLTCQKPLDEFWKDGTRPDNNLVEDLERLLARTIQVKGCFYTDQGRRAGARDMARKLAEGSVNLPGALCEVPPRLEKARQMGIATTFAEQMASHEGVPPNFEMPHSGLVKNPKSRCTMPKKSIAESPKPTFFLPRCEKRISVFIAPERKNDVL